jgi:hypothetical protein
MKMKKTMMIAALALACGTATALTLKEQKQFKAWQDYLKDPDQSYVKSVKDKCGYDIPLSMGQEFVTPFMKDNASAPSYCDSTRGTISGMCEDETSKTAIKKNIKKIECKLGKEKETAFKLANGTFTFTVGVNASNLDSKIKEWLENNLK